MDLNSVTVTLTLKIETRFSYVILWLMIMRHHTKFDGSEILSGQPVTEVHSLHCDLDLEYSKSTFSQDTPAFEHALSN